MRRIARREFLLATGAVPATASLPMASAEETWSSGMERPAFNLPEGAIDCHVHIYDDRFPVALGTTLRPPNATVEQYRLLQSRLGVKRNMVVTPSTYGTDNRCTLEAIRQFKGNARGVAVVGSSVSDAELHKLDSGGIRAIRFNLSRAGVARNERKGAGQVLGARQRGCDDLSPACRGAGSCRASDLTGKGRLAAVFACAARWTVGAVLEKAIC